MTGYRPAWLCQGATQMTRGVSHDRSEETPEAKARWFQSLSLAERMEMLCWFTNLALSANPDLADRKDARPARGRVRILRLEDVGK
jgi:hypothetical protein